MAVIPCCRARDLEIAMAARRATKASVITLTADERSYLDRLVRRRKVARGDALRAEIVLAAAEGMNNKAIAAKVGVTRPTVRTWRERFAKHRLDGMSDEPRCGAPRKIGDDKIEAIVTMTLEEKPKDATHWSTRGMSKASGVSTSSVNRIWRAFSLQPHRTDTFKLSTDPQFVEKVRDIVGLYLDPPEKAIVICVDEKSQIQALDRTQPMLPMRPGQIERRTHDYERHGTTTLFAGFIAAVTAETDIKAGAVIGQCMPRHRAQEFRKFLDEVERNVPAGLDIHVVMDNASSHKTKAIRNWFAKRPRWHTHFTPTSSSWINQVERFFALIAEKQIKRGAHTSVAALIASIEAYIRQHNTDPKPLRWTKSADDILASIERFCTRTLDAQAASG
jgi:transposase